MISAAATLAASALFVAAAVVLLPSTLWAINRRPGKPPLAWTRNP